MIMAFSGTFSDGYPINAETGIVDKHWHLCDGSNGTPDLRGKFVLGASDSHAVDSTGGEENHTLTEAELPTITGSFRCTVPGNHINFADGVFSGCGGEKTALIPNCGNEINPAYGYILKFGGGKAHENMPPYYSLCFIMRI